MSHPKTLLFNTTWLLPGITWKSSYRLYTLSLFTHLYKGRLPVYELIWNISFSRLSHIALKFVCQFLIWERCLNPWRLVFNYHVWCLIASLDLASWSNVLKIIYRLRSFTFTECQVLKSEQRFHFSYCAVYKYKTIQYTNHLS